MLKVTDEFLKKNFELQDTRRTAGVGKSGGHHLVPRRG